MNFFNGLIQHYILKIAIIFSAKTHNIPDQLIMGKTTIRNDFRPDFTLRTGHGDK